MAAGVVLATVSIAADYLAGEVSVQVGLKQVLGCMFGLGLLLAGALLSPSRRAAGDLTVRFVFALYLAGCSLVLSRLGALSSPTLVLFGDVAAICLLLPLRFGIPTLAAVLVLHVSATAISHVKVALTELPLTIMDIRIATRNPGGLWDAMAFPHWTLPPFVAVMILALAWWAFQGLRAARDTLRSVRAPGARRWLLGRVVAVVTFGGLAVAYLGTLYASMAADQTTWEPAGVAEMADRVGALPFLAYSHDIEARTTGDIFGDDSGAVQLARDEVAAAVNKYVDFQQDRGTPSVGVLPNIAVILAESTFDPGTAFRLEGQWNDELFVPGRHTAAVGPLRVNPLGGATWITEFETIVGLDSRLFGYSGFYTHASVAPFVERSIATYLRARGYTTLAFFPTEGNFYNARRAYEHYGFQVVRDSKDLGHEGWMSNDVAIVESVKASLGAKPRAPFLAYVLLLENHAPHACGLPDASSFRVHFSDSSEFEPNCALHEYLRRQDSTTAAVRAMRQYLADLEARTGRPFVLLVFGDHQPHTFTTTGGIQFDYAPMRRNPDARITFFHFQSSAPSRLRCCKVPPPATVLPTLLSSFVARSPQDVYLGESLWLYSECGSNAIRWQFGVGMVGQQVQGTDDRTQACKSAYRRALASFRAAGVVRVAAGEATGG